MTYFDIDQLKNKRSFIYEYLIKKKYQNLLNLLFELNISKYDLKKLRLVIKELILTSLNIYYKKKFKKINKYLDFYSKEISAMPNITPNGNIMPRKEIIIFYKRIHSILEKILNKNFKNSYNYTTRPYVLYKNPNSPFKKRERATNKWHTDVWAGHNLSSIGFIFVDGDFKNNCVKVSIPNKIKSNFLKEVKKYNDGKSLYSSKTFLKKCNLSKLYIMDNLLLHKTCMNKNSKARIGLQFGINFNYKFIKKKKYNMIQKSKLNCLSHIKFLEKKSLL